MIRKTSLVLLGAAAGVAATLIATQPPERFGILDLDGAMVTKFREKDRKEGGWVNGGYFVLSPKVLDYIEGDNTVWEGEPLERLAQEKQLSAFKHSGFWYAMDTQRDRDHLNQLWLSGQAPWVSRPLSMP